MTPDPTMGWATRLISKLPSFRGIANYFYVAANWGRISEEQEAYRRQIKDREEWAKQALAQQAQLHDLAQQRATEEARLWQAAAERATDQTQRVLDTLEKWKQVADQRGETMMTLGNRYVEGMVVLAQVLAKEAPVTRALLMGSLDEATRTTVTALIARVEEIERPHSAGGFNVLPPPS